MRGDFYGYFFAITENTRFFRIFNGQRGFIQVIDLLGFDNIALKDDKVMRLTTHGVIGQQDHFVAGNINNLLVLRVERPHRQEAVFREFAPHGQVFAVSGPGFRLCGVGVAGLVMHVQAVNDVFSRFIAIVISDGFFHVPLDHLAVQEQRRVGVATAIKGGVQWAQADFHFSNDRIVNVLQLAIEPVQHFAQLDGGGGGRELACANEVLAIGRGVYTMGVFRYGHVASQGGQRILVRCLGAVHHRHFGRAIGGELAGLHGFFNAGDVEEQASIALCRHHVFVVHAHFHVVLVGCSQLAVVGGGGQVAVAVDQYLPAHFHGFGIHTREQRTVFFRGVGIGAIVGQGHGELGTAKNSGGVVDGGIDRIGLVGENSVETLDVRQRRDLVANKIIQANTGNAAVELVVHPCVTAIVVAVLVRSVQVVRVGHVVQRAALGIAPHHIQGFIGNPPANQRIGTEARNA